jgi:hypothetical protein
MNKFSLLKLTVFASTIALLTSYSVRAEITKQSANSFTIKHSFISKKSVSLAKHQFGHVGWWWTSEFTHSGKGRNMFFNGKGMHERMPNGKTLTHLTKVKKGEWNGALGKLKNADVKGEMKVSIKAHHHNTKVTMEYTVTSDQLAANKSWPKYADGMLAAQMNNLKDSLNKR